MIYLINEIWFHFFSIVIQIYEDKYAKELVNFAIFLLNDLHKKKITPCLSLYSKLVRSCSRPSLHVVLKEIIFKNIPHNLHTCPSISANAYMNGIYDKENAPAKQEDTNTSTSISFRTNRSSRFVKYSSMRFTNLVSGDNSVQLYSNQISDLITNTIFMLYDYCPNCLRKQSKGKMSVEEILAGFKKEKNTFHTTCNICLVKMFPRIYFINNNIGLDQINSVNFLSPLVLTKEVDNLIKNYGEKHFFISDYFKHNEHKHIFWNLVFYFGILGLPSFVLFILRKEEKIDLLIESLELFKTKDASKRASTSVNGQTKDDSGSEKLSSSIDIGGTMCNFNIGKTNIRHYESIILNKM
jgi:hypothetical protein